MIKVKSFTAQLKIFHARTELDELDKEVCDFIASQGIRKSRIVAMSFCEPRSW